MMIRRILLALCLLTSPALAQGVPPPVPALPDIDRVQSYSITATACTCAVNFALYGDSTDYQNWLTVYVNKVAVAYNDATFGWKITSPTGPLGSIPRPVTDGVLTFNNVQTGTIDIVGARRPRRAVQFSENRGVAARDLNQAVTDIIAVQREFWDLWERSMVFEPGFFPNALPLAASRAGQFLCFAVGTGQPTTCVATTGSTTFAAGTGIALSGVSPTTISADISAGTGITFTGTHPIVISRGTGALNAQTLDYTIQTSDCGLVVVSSGGFKTITLPAIGTVPSGCEVGIKNNETYPGGRGKKLANFPADFLPSPVVQPILWPNQVGYVKSNGTIWMTTQAPGRWQHPAAVTIHVDKTNGLNTNDGLATGAGNAIQDAATAFTIVSYASDIQAHTPIIAMTCGQTHTVALGMGGTPLGGNLIQMSPDGNCGFTMSNAGPCIIIGDLAELDLNLNFYGSSGQIILNCNTANAASTGNVYMHNANVLDQEGTMSWAPGGANDNLWFCDGPCEGTIANGATQLPGTGNYLMYMNEGGKITLSGALTGQTGANAQGSFSIFGGALLIRGTSDVNTWTSIGASRILGHATYVNNGTTTAGGITVGTSGANCASLVSTVC